MHWNHGLHRQQNVVELLRIGTINRRGNHFYLQQVTRCRKVSSFSISHTEITVIQGKNCLGTVIEIYGLRRSRVFMCKCIFAFIFLMK